MIFKTAGNRLARLTDEAAKLRKDNHGCCLLVLFYPTDTISFLKH